MPALTALPAKSEPTFALWMQQQQLKARTVYITRRCRSAHLRGKSLVVCGGDDGEQEHSIALSHVRRLVFVGRPRVGQHLVYDCLRHDIHVDFLDIFGRPLGLSIPLGGANSSSRPYQLKQVDGEKSLTLARCLIVAKIANGWAVLRRRVQLPPSCSDLVHKARMAENAQQLRGIEGAAAHCYFAHMAQLTKKFNFSKRQARPAPDPVNMMLSLGYGMLHNRLASALHSTGLDSRLGFFHQGRGAHFALASDLMEDLRFIVDRIVLRLIGLGQLHPQDFKQRMGRCAFATSHAFGVFINAFEDSMGKYFTAPCTRPSLQIGDTINMNSWLDACAQEYALWLQGRAEYTAMQVLRRPYGELSLVARAC